MLESRLIQSKGSLAHSSSTTPTPLFWEFSDHCSVLRLLSSVLLRNTHSSFMHGVISHVFCEVPLHIKKHWCQNGILWYHNHNNIAIQKQSCVFHCEIWHTQIFFVYWLTHCDPVTSYGIIAFVNIGSGNGLLPDGTKPLPKPVVMYHH